MFADCFRSRSIPSPSWLPDGYSQIFRSYVFGPSGFWTMAPLRYTAKLDPFLSLDCAPTPSTLAQFKERKGSCFAAQHSGAIVQKPEGPNTYNLKFCLQPSGNHASATRVAAEEMKWNWGNEDSLRVSRHATGEGAIQEQEQSTQLRNR